MRVEAVRTPEILVDRFEYRLTEDHPFTPRQADVLLLRMQGLTNKEVASRLGLSPISIPSYIRSSLHFYCREDTLHYSKSELAILGLVYRETGELHRNLDGAIGVMLRKGILLQVPLCLL